MEKSFMIKIKEYEDDITKLADRAWRFSRFNPGTEAGISPVTIHRGR
jgi:hypothetical protein